MSATQQPDYGEPWQHTTFRNCIRDRHNTLRQIEDDLRDRSRICVNACAGMADPAAEIAAMREAIKNASHFAAHILTESGKQWQATEPLPDVASIEAVAQQIQDELQPFIAP